MMIIQNFLYIQRLFLAWQTIDHKERFIVGEIVKGVEPKYVFSYNKDTADYEKACSLDFKGYSGFKVSGSRYDNNVIELFSKRLPPRSRGDFRRYLSSHCLPEGFMGDAFSLLAHTAGQLPSDGFFLIPDLLTAVLPFDYLLEVAGTRFYLERSEVDELDVGSEVFFQDDLQNEQDANAMSVHSGTKKLGYVNRLLCSQLRTLFEKHNCSAFIAKKNGTLERPLIYLLLRVH